MSAENYRDVGASVDQRVADLLSRMTLEEKVAQLGAIWVTQLVNNNAFDDAVTRDLLAHGIGQITRIGASTGLLAEDSAILINQIQHVAVEHTRVGSSVLEVVRAAAPATGRDVPYEIGPRRAGDVVAAWADASLAATLLGWRASRSLADMCADHWCWQSTNPDGLRAT